MLVFFCQPVSAAQAKAGQTDIAADSLRISLLTCAAGGEIYSLFGHTAIRYENLTQGIDVVFNYGMFDFGTPNFALRFALGETDYWLGLNSFRGFTTAYLNDGRDVWQQTLNLSQAEKERLVQQLEENYLPENRIYRYNIFYDNCATRPRDQIERAIDGTLQYADNMTDNNVGISFRELLHTYSEGHPWSRFGMDLCMGSKADEPINRRLTMFVPFCMQEYFNKAQIIDKEGHPRPLVAKEEKIVTTGRTPADFITGGITPMQSALLLLAFTIGLSVYGIRRGKTCWGADLALFAVAGIAGCILAFMALFSQHPAVSPNYLLFVFHPFHLLCLPCMLRRIRKRKLSRYMMGNLIVLTLFITLWAIIPQRIPPTVLPLALCLLIRSANNVLMCKRAKMQMTCGMKPPHT